MQKISIVSIILILGLGYAVQDEGIQVLNPQFSGNDLTIPKSFNFQGYLYRDGNPMDTTMNMWFGIYDSPSSGTQLFQQTINNVVVTKGWFTVTLDNIPNSVFPVGGLTRYLEVKAPSTGPSLSPRISLVSVGYSYHAITADSAEYAKAATLSRPITPLISGTEIAKVLPDIASRYYGYGGWCELNAAGDRVPGNYNIWGYDTEGYHLFGKYDSASETLTWIG